MVSAQRCVTLVSLCASIALLCQACATTPRHDESRWSDEPRWTSSPDPAEIIHVFESPDAPKPPRPAGPPTGVIRVSLAESSREGFVRATCQYPGRSEDVEVAIQNGTLTPYRSRLVPQYQLTEMPQFRGVLENTTVLGLYPEEARTKGLAGEVVVKVGIDSDGSVTKLVLLSDTEHGFGEAARARMVCEKFMPAKFQGEAVASEITFTVRFDKDD